jgi:hypothetical protein
MRGSARGRSCFSTRTAALLQLGSREPGQRSRDQRHGAARTDHQGPKAPVPRLELVAVNWIGPARAFPAQDQELIQDQARAEHSRRHHAYPDRFHSALYGRACPAFRVEASIRQPLKRRSLELSFGEVVGVAKPAVDSASWQSSAEAADASAHISTFDGAPHDEHFVEVEIVHHDDVARPQPWSEAPLNTKRRTSGR